MCDSDISLIDFPKICRVCLQSTENVESIIALQMTTLYKLLTDIDVKQEDVFPKNICNVCKHQLTGINLFIEKCKNSDRVLRKVYLEESDTDVYCSDNCGFDQNEELVLPTEVKNDTKGIVPSSLSVTNKKKACSICGERISRGGVRKHYMLSKKCRPDDCKCPVCDKSYYPRHKLKIHLRSHKKETPYECPKCRKKFVFAENLRKHALTHKDVKPFVCNICEKGFLRKRSLDEHTNFHTGETPYICAYCGEGFKRLAEHASHIYRTHTGDIEQVPKHQRKYTEKRVHLKLECKSCGKVFASRSGYDNHQLIHAGVKRFLCNVCGRKFITNPTLQRHIGTHTGEKPFECKECGKLFNQRHSLYVHMSRHATQSLSCPHCDKKYYSTRGLNQHVFAHVNDKLLECSECDKYFYQETALLKHILQEHRGEKPHRCSMCSKSFRSPSHLKAHLRIHTGEKPHACPVCGKQLAQAQTLKVHLRQHTGETPYVCSVCEKGFHDSSNLKRHFKRHHDGGNGTVKSETKVFS